jgi:hypothetical protein
MEERLVSERLFSAIAFVALFTLAPPASPQSSASITVAAAPKTSGTRLGPLEEEFTQRLAEAQKVYTQVNDYVSTLVMQERLEGELRPRSVGLIKFRKPYSVYLKWHEGPQAGTQALYVAGENDGKVLARKGGLLGLATFRLQPTSRLALSENRHPITEAGLGFMLDLIESNRKRAVANGCARVRRLDERAALQPQGPRYELVVEADGNAGYYCRRALVTFDPRTRLLVAVQVFDWNNRLIEDYRYLNVRLNVGLTDRDFDPKNPAYNF